MCFVTYAYGILQVEHPTGNDLNGGLYDAMRKEFRHVVEEMRMEIEQVCTLNLLCMLHSVFCVLKLPGFFASHTGSSENKILHFTK